MRVGLSYHAFISSNKLIGRGLAVPTSAKVVHSLIDNYPFYTVLRDNITVVTIYRRITEASPENTITSDTEIKDSDVSS